ncbi:sialin-like [Planococcus citri]|uniref:sialin-like n=1 Tax=Planococcus citri TaxID=170843 RepID=UPI0031F8452C
MDSCDARAKDDVPNMDHSYSGTIGTKNNETQSSSETQKIPLLFSKRLAIVMILFVGNITAFLIKYNVNVAVIDMTFQKRVKIGNVTVIQQPEFLWNSKTIGTVISLTAYGALLAFMSGFVISKLGASLSCALSMMMCGITTLLYSIALHYNFYSFVACRLLTGIFLGFYFPSFLEIFSRWVPQCERVSLLAFTYNGLSVGLALVHPFCGFLAFKWGWPMIFYTTGSISLIMALLFLTLLKNSPSEDKSISKKELSYILDGLETKNSTQKVVHPYRKIATSLSIWALCIAYFVHISVICFLGDCLPLYIKDITGKNIKDVGFITSVPNIVNVFMFSLTGFLFQYWKNNSNISSTRMSKIVMAFGFIIEMVLFLALTMVSDFVTIMFILVAMRFITPLNSLNIQLIVINIAPGHTGMIAGIGEFCSQLANILTQTIIGFMTVNRSMEEWNRCFNLIAGICAFSTVIFTLFGSSEAQGWALEPSSNHKDDRNSSSSSIRTITK